VKIDERSFEFALEIIASKEARETSYWLRLFSLSGYLEHYQKKDELLGATESIVNIITKIVKTTRVKQ